MVSLRPLSLIPVIVIWLLPVYGGILAPTPLPRAEAQSAVNPNTESWEILPLVAELNLTANQQQQLQQIADQTRGQIQQIVTPEQRDQFWSRVQTGGSMRQAALSMDLSMDQRQQLRPVLLQARDQITGVLTPEQRQQVETVRSRMGF